MDRETWQAAVHGVAMVSMHEIEISKPYLKKKLRKMDHILVILLNKSESNEA